MSPLSDERRALCAANLGLAISVAAPLKRQCPRRADEIESAANLALVQAASTWGRIPGIGFAAWAYPRILSVALRAMLRGDRCRAGRTGEGDDPELLLDRGPPVGSGLEARDQVDHLTRRLPPRLRELLRLLYAEGLTQREAAGRMGHDQAYISRLHAKAIRMLA